MDHCNFQKSCSYIVKEATANPTKNTSVQSKNHIQAWTRSVHNLSKNKYKEIKGMIQSTTNILECMTMCELQEATSQDQHLQHLMEYVIQGWPNSKNQLP